MNLIEEWRWSTFQEKLIILAIFILLWAGRGMAWLGAAWLGKAWGL